MNRSEPRRPAAYLDCATEGKWREGTVGHLILKAENEELAGLSCGDSRVETAKNSAPEAKSVVEQLARDLQTECRSMSGISWSVCGTYGSLFGTLRRSEGSTAGCRFSWSDSSAFLGRGESPDYLCIGVILGIILCKEENRAVVESALNDDRNRFGVVTSNNRPKLSNGLEGRLRSPRAVTRLLDPV